MTAGPYGPGTPARTRRARVVVVRGLGAALATLVVAAGAAACGIPAEEEPHSVVPPPPFQSTSPAPPSEGTVSGAAAIFLCLTRDDHLVRVPRQIEDDPTPEALLAELATGATAAEKEQGLDSELTGIAANDGPVTIENRIATVTLGEGLAGISPASQLFAYGQIVCTLDLHPAIDGVFFSRDGQRLAVPRGDGTSTEGMLTAGDYETLLEPPA